MHNSTPHPPLVRELAWLIEAPPLVHSRLPGPPDRVSLGLADDSIYRRWLEQLEADADTLEQYVAQTGSKRLGFYVERLWQFILERAPATRLLAHNLSLREGRRTIGELDLLYDDTESSQPVHMEAAIKFYLGLPEGPGMASDQSRWIGTSGPDSLAGKHERLLTRQLPLSRHSAAWAILHEFGAPPLRSRLGLKGVLFYPWHADRPTIIPTDTLSAITGMPAPKGATADHPRGVWLRWREWSDFVTMHRLTGVVRLHKPHWLALPPTAHYLFPESLLPELEDCRARGALPIQLAVYGDRLPPLRVMLVDDNWPRFIPLPPRRAPVRRTIPSDWRAPWPR